MVVFPALALLIALGARHTLPLIRPARWPRAAQTGCWSRWRGRWPPGRRGIISAFLDLFNVEARQHVRYDADDALPRAAAFPPGTQVHIIAENVLPQTDAQHLANFLADDLVVLVEHPDTMSEVYFPMLARTVDHAFFIPPDEPHIAALIAGAFGAGPLVGSPYNVPPEKMLWLYYLPADPAASAGTEAAGGRPGGRIPDSGKKLTTGDTERGIFRESLYNSPSVLSEYSVVQSLPELAMHHPAAMLDRPRWLVVR